jgi:hypothetical protein
MMKREIVILSLIVLVGCSHAQPRRPDPRITSGADAELFLAVFRGNSNQVALALQRGANINARHHGLMEAARLEGATPLYAAVFDNKPEIVASVLALGADPTIPNEVGETPLQLAHKRNFAEIVQILTKESSNQVSHTTVECSDVDWLHFQPPEPGNPLRISMPGRLRLWDVLQAAEVRVWTDAGDEELVKLLPIGDAQSNLEGEIPTGLAPAVKADGILQVLGGEIVHCELLPFKKDNSGMGRRIKYAFRVRSESQLIATETVQVGQPVNLRVADPGASTTTNRDKVYVQATTSNGDHIDRVELAETAPYSGIFEGAIQTVPVSAMAYASDSSEGSGMLGFPSGVISASNSLASKTLARRVASGEDEMSLLWLLSWTGGDDNRKPRWVRVEMSAPQALGSMTIVADVPGRSLRQFQVEVSRDGADFACIAAWPSNVTPLEATQSLQAGAFHPAVMTVAPDSGSFMVTFASNTVASAIRLWLREFDSYAPTIRKISLTSAGGRRLLPVDQDISQRWADNQLDVMVGDRITIRYENPNAMTNKFNETVITVTKGNPPASAGSRD